MKMNPHILQERIDHILEGDGSYLGVNVDTVYDKVAENREVIHELLKCVLSGDDKEAFYLALRETQEACEWLLVSAEESRVIDL